MKFFTLLAITAITYLSITSCQKVELLPGQVLLRIENRTAYCLENVLSNEYDYQKLQAGKKTDYVSFDSILIYPAVNASVDGKFISWMSPLELTRYLPSYLDEGIYTIQIISIDTFGQTGYLESTLLKD